MKSFYQPPAAAGRSSVRALRFILLVVIMTALALSVAACKAPDAGKDSAGGEPVGHIKVGLLPIVDSLPFFVAEQKGYFAEEKVEVKLEVYQSAVLRDTALQAGEIDGFVGDILAAAALKNAGYPLKIVSVSLGVTPEEGRFAILAVPGSNIDSVEDLKGLPIALSKNTIIEYVVDRLLLNVGFSPDEIRDQVIPRIPDRFQMLMSGEIQAACLPDPQAAFAVHQGAELVVDDTGDINISQTIILFTDGAIANKGEAINRLLRAYGRAAEDINENPDAFRDLLVEKARLPEPIKDTYRVDYFSPPQVPTREQVQSVLDWMVAKGIITGDMTYEDIVETRFTSGAASPL